MTKVVVDAMGGDHAPSAILEGIKQCLDRNVLPPEQIVVTGPLEQVRGLLRQQNLPETIEVVDAPQLLSADDSPVDGIRRKPRNSIAVGLGLLKDKRGDAFVSAGSTGSVVATATYALRCLDGVRRAGIAVVIEGESGPFIIIDVGANPQPKPIHLVQYGLMGAAYHHDTFGTANPRVGLMNIGSEDSKGSPLIKRAAELLRQAPTNFIGNVEGVDVFRGVCDVIVSDGFTGNVLLKASEGVAEYVVHTVARLMDESGITEADRRAVLGRLHRRVDYSEYGGALLLGIEGIVTICHGRSGPQAICNAIRFAAKAVGADLNQHIVNAMRTCPAENA